MNYRCPNCEANLRWRFYPSRIFTKLFKTLQVNVFTGIGRCPSCDAELGFRVHFTEEGLSFNLMRVVTLAVLCVMAGSQWELSRGFGSVVIVVLFLAFVVYTLGLILQLLERRPQPWRRFIEKSRQGECAGENATEDTED